jgi:hypothetical protein
MATEETTQPDELARIHGVGEVDIVLFVDYYEEALAECQSEIEGLKPHTPEQIALDHSLDFLNMYRQQRANGHGDTWAKAYARAYVLTGEEDGCIAEMAYEALRVKDPRITAAGAVYREAYETYMRQGHNEEDAAAVANHIAKYKAYNIDKYVTMYTRARAQGRSILEATDYARIQSDY